MVVSVPLGIRQKVANMTSLYRVRTELTGFGGGPGVATMYFLDTDTAVASVHDFWGTVAAAMPPVVHMQVVPAGDIIESTTGTITGAWAASAVTEVVGQGAADYASPAGVIVGWGTNTILDGRRLRGRTFIVPLSFDAYQNDGTIGTTTLPNFVNAATGLISEQADSFVIWHRPREAVAADGSRPAITARAGGHGLVVRHTVPDKVAVLRSRRA